MILGGVKPENSAGAHTLVIGQGRSNSGFEQTHAEASSFRRMPACSPELNYWFDRAYRGWLARSDQLSLLEDAA